MDYPGERNSPADYSTRRTLLLRLNTNDAKPRELAWEVFRKRYAPVIAGFARKLGVKTHEIDDVIQDVLVGFYAQSPNFIYDPAKGRFRGYLKVCTFRAVQRRQGKRLKFKALPLDEVEDQDIEVEQLWQDVWMAEHLNRAVAAVRQQYENNHTFRAFERFVIKGEPAAQVAEDLGMQVNGVYKAKERVALAVRAQLEALENEEG
jgi:DNA-directed RNA polymerase specialized sigma24 family protein